MELTADIELGKFNDALYRLARETGKDFGFVVKRNARLLAVSLAVSTQPWQGREGNFKSLAKGDLQYNGFLDRKMGEMAVRRDIGRVYRALNDVYARIAQKSKDAAAGFWGTAMSGNFKKARQIMKGFQLGDLHTAIGKFDKGTAHKRARNKRGRVPSQRAELIVTNPKAVGIYARKIERRVGMAKGGFAGAAAGLGGMRGLPQWVTRHKGGGSASDHTTSGNNPHAVLHNNVPWINQVLSRGAMQDALFTQRGRMEAHIHHVVAGNARKAGFAVHGYEGEAVPAG